MDRIPNFLSDGQIYAHNLKVPAERDLLLLQANTEGFFYMQL